MNLSLCITTYNRYEMTIESFAKVIDDPRIDDIVIMDDASTDGSGVDLAHRFKNSEKVNVVLGFENQGMSRNKRNAISKAKNEWCIIFDSDNVIDADYLDAFYAYVGENGLAPFANIDVEKYIFCPDFARPNFDYRSFAANMATRRSGIYDCGKAKIFIANDDFNCLMNTCNYIVNRDFYLSTYQHNKEHIASDTVWHNYNHLRAGGMFVVVPGMQYYHRTHAGSGFLQDVKYNMAKSAEVRKLIQQL